MPADVVEILQQLVATASVNAMGRPVTGPEYGEAALTDLLEKTLRGLGLATHRQEVAPGRENLIARLDGQIPPERGGPLILLDAHQDTVPADNMSIPPWTPTVRDGRLYGRGACDTKGGMAAILAVLARMAAERPPGRPSLIATFTVDEEYALAGAPALASAWAQNSGGLIPRPPDAAVVAEPTGLDVITAHKGVVRWRCHTLGQPAHSSHPAAGRNAIYAMARVVTALEYYQNNVLAGTASHPRCGSPTLNVGIIAGGSSINIVPDRCTIEMEVRFPPGQTAAEMRRRAIEFLAGQPGIDPPPLHDPPYMQGEPLPDCDNGLLAERLAAAAVQVAGRCQQRAVPYGTNAAYFSRAGTPAVVFGPGAIEQAHTDNEWVSVEQVRQAAEILYDFTMSWK